MSTPFVLFGASHITAIVASFVLPVVIVAAIHPRARPTFDRAFRWSLAALLTANWIAWMSFLYFKGWLGLGNELPLNLCDFATVATVATLVYPNQTSYELAYFWALAATLQGMMTPDVKNEFPDIEFVLFFVFHGGIIAAVLYMTFGLGWRPVPASLPRVIVWTLFYAAVAGFADWLLGTNYAFLRAKPPFARSWFHARLALVHSCAGRDGLHVYCGLLRAFLHPRLVGDAASKRERESMTVRDNPELSRFELEEKGLIAFANYRRHGEHVVIPHVEAAPTLARHRRR